MKAVVFYEHNANKTMDEFMAVFPHHEAFEADFLKSGKVLGTGAFANPGEGAMAIFVDKDSAEAFVLCDIFPKNAHKINSQNSNIFTNFVSK